MRLNKNNESAMDLQVEDVIAKAKKDESVLAVMLFGSQARGEGMPASDVDVCLVLSPGKETKADQEAVKWEYLSFQSKRLDLHIYQQLPLYIQTRVLKEGKVLFCRDEDALYKTAYRTARAFEDFRPFYREYLEQVARAGP